MDKLNICFYSVKDYELSFIRFANQNTYNLRLNDVCLSLDNVHYVKGCEVVSLFSRDKCNKEVLSVMKELGVKLITLRSTGYDNVDLETATKLGIKVAHVPSYSPESIAEHTLMLALLLLKNFKKAQLNISACNFNLTGLLGTNLGEMTVGVIGTGMIGLAFIRLLKGLGAKVMAYDILPSSYSALRWDYEYVELDELYAKSDLISLHIPMNENNRYFIDENSLSKMKTGVFIINTSGGKLINTKHVLTAIRNNKVRGLGLDVYENEADFFFEKHHNVNDPLLNELIENERIILTGHQAFFTHTALRNIAIITFKNIANYRQGRFDQNFLV